LALAIAELTSVKDDSMITVGAPRVTGGKIEVPIAAAGSTRRYFRHRVFWADFAGMSLDDVDPAILVIPALGTVLPVAWAAGEAVQVEGVDAEYAEAAEELGHVIGAMYPQFATDEFHLNGERIQAAAQHHSGALQLYSGGVDSATTLIRHKEEMRELVSVWGADVDLQNKALWQQLQTLMSVGTLTSAHERVVVKSNLRTVIDVTRLNYHFGKSMNGIDWWPAIHHGIGLISLTAPIASAKGRKTVYVASSHSAEFNTPWGSAPSLDNLIRWAGTRVVHDGYEYNRQAKVQRVITPWITAGGKIKLAVCYKASRGGDSLNCGHCEKCIRTASALIVSGINPASAGVPTTSLDLEQWQRQLNTDSLTFTPNEVYQWKAIQDEVRTTRTPARQDSEYESYLEWLADFDFTSVPSPAHRQGFLITGGRRRLSYLAELGFRPLPFRLQQFIRRRLQL